MLNNVECTVVFGVRGRAEDETRREGDVTHVDGRSGDHHTNISAALDLAKHPHPSPAAAGFR